MLQNMVRENILEVLLYGKIKFDYSKAGEFVNDNEIAYLKDAVKISHDMLHNKTGAGNDF